MEPKVAEGLRFGAKTRFGVSVIAILIGTATAVYAQDSTVITKQYDDGGVYEGTFKDGKQHGMGQMLG